MAAAAVPKASGAPGPMPINRSAATSLEQRAAHMTAVLAGRTAPKIFTRADALKMLADMEAAHQREADWRKAEAEIALKRRQFMRQGHPLSVAHAAAVAAIGARAA